MDNEFMASYFMDGQTFDLRVQRPNDLAKWTYSVRRKGEDGELLPWSRASEESFREARHAFAAGMKAASALSAP
jgi:hypothetical protein